MAAAPSPPPPAPRRDGSSLRVSGRDARTHQSLTSMFAVAQTAGAARNAQTSGPDDRNARQPMGPMRLDADAARYAQRAGPMGPNGAGR